MYQSVIIAGFAGENEVNVLFAMFREENDQFKITQPVRQYLYLVYAEHMGFSQNRYSKLSAAFSRVIFRPMFASTRSMCL